MRCEWRLTWIYGIFWNEYVNKPVRDEYTLGIHYYRLCIEF